MLSGIRRAIRGPPGQRPADPAYEEGPVGLRACDRVFTCILYLNDEWEAPHEGCLRIFTAAVDEAAARSGEGLDEGSFVDVEPKGGRLVIFDSFLWHEVLPAKGRARFAVTLWITRPELQDAAAT